MNKIEIKMVKIKDIGNSYRVFNLDGVASPNICEQVANIIKRLQEIPRDILVIPAIEDKSFCFANKIDVFFEILKKELQKNIVNFRKIYLYKTFQNQEGHDVIKGCFLITQV